MESQARPSSSLFKPSSSKIACQRYRTVMKILRLSSPPYWKGNNHAWPQRPKIVERTRWLCFPRCDSRWLGSRKCRSISLRSDMRALVHWRRLATSSFRVPDWNKLMALLVMRWRVATFRSRQTFFSKELPLNPNQWLHPSLTLSPRDESLRWTTRKRKKQVSTRHSWKCIWSIMRKQAV